MKKFKLLFTLVLLLGAMTLFTGCRKEYDVPEYKTIEPSQTAFLIPLVGDTGEQGMFESEELLEKSKVPTKRVRIPHMWSQTGRRDWQGEWIPSATLIVVERKPETREWTSTKDTGTASANQGVKAESKGSITFGVSMNVSAQINEEDATKFLYRYNNKTLKDVMDTEIRAMIESEFVEECAKREMAQILTDKKEIMDAIRNKVTPYFKQKGISITVLGLKGDVTYADSKIQEAINLEFTAIKKQEAQVIINQTNIAKADAEAKALKKAQESQNAMKIAEAEAEAQAIKIRASTLNEQIKLKELEIQLELVKTWDGKYPQFMAGEGNGMIMNLPTLE